MKVSIAKDQSLEHLRPDREPKWQMVMSGYWSQTPFHEGHIAYFVTCTAAGTWLLESVERSIDEFELQDDSDIDDNLYRCIAAAAENVPGNFTAEQVGKLLYEATAKSSGKWIDEPDEFSPSIPP